MKVLLIDNYDSFTYNLYHYLSSLKCKVEVYRNDKININKILKNNYQKIVISPGPGNPNQAGFCLKIVRYFYKTIPILGVCLGHQAIGKAFKCSVKKHSSIYHGKTSIVYQDKSSKLYKGIPYKFSATRYHSLVIDNKSVHSGNIIINAWLNDKTIMGIEHSNYPLYGVQFHPESIATEFGDKIIKNFLNIV